MKTYLSLAYVCLYFFICYNSCNILSLVQLPHIVTSHLASLLYTTVPALLAASLYSLLSRLASANTMFLLTSLLPGLPILAGACFVTIRALRNYPRMVVSRREPLIGQ